jgi:hypothetical protein
MSQATFGRSAEPAPATSAQRAELTMTAAEQTHEMGQWIKDLAAGRPTFAYRLANRQNQTIPSEDPDCWISDRHSRSGVAQPGARSCSRPPRQFGVDRGELRLNRDADL